MKEYVLVPIDFEDKLVKLSVDDFKEILNDTYSKAYMEGYEKGKNDGLRFKMECSEL